MRRESRKVEDKELGGDSQKKRSGFKGLKLGRVSGMLQTDTGT